MEVESVKNITKISLLRSIALLAMVVVVFLFYINPVHSYSDIFIVMLCGVIYIMLSVKYFQEQIKLWKHIPKFRYISRYYISFTVIWTIILLGLSISAYLLFDNIPMSLATFMVFVTETTGFYIIYSKSLHFIAVKPNHIMIVKRRINIITPEETSAVYYRNDILIFKLKNEQTIFVNFLETDDSKSLRQEIAEWMKKNQMPYNEIISELSKRSSC